VGASDTKDPKKAGMLRKRQAAKDIKKLKLPPYKSGSGDSLDKPGKSSRNAKKGSKVKSKGKTKELNQK
jgi:hypothetical protein